MDRNIKENLIKSYNANSKERDNGKTDNWKLNERSIFLDYLKKERKTTLLDLGAGSGRDSKLFKDNGLKTICIDLSSASIDICKEKGLEAYTMDFYNLDFNNESFDCAWSLNSLLHVPKKDMSIVLEELKRVLKHGSLIYIGVYGGVDSEYIWEEDRYEPKRFFSYYTRDKIKELMKNYFEILYFNEFYAENKKMDFYSMILRKN